MLSEERRKKMLGRTVSQKTREKISNTLKGQPISAERREKISNTLKGRKLPEERIENLVKCNSKPFCLISPDGERIEGVNLKKFCRDAGICVTSIRQVLKGTLGGFKGWTKP